MDDGFVEAVLSVVERVPAGRVTTYGAIADHVGSGGPRQVGRVMALYGGLVPWWRVVRADGAPPACYEGVAARAYLAEGTPMRAPGRLELSRAFWDPGTFTHPVQDGRPAVAGGPSRSG